jgi:hypothetical protein
MLKKKTTIDIRTVRQNRQRALDSQEIVKLRRDVNALKEKYRKLEEQIASLQKQQESLEVSEDS